MFGVTIRAAVQALAAVLVAAIMAEILPLFVGVMGHEDHWLVEGFQAVNAWGLTVMFGSLLVLLLARAITENSLPG